jgi:hypothetical protein
MRLESVYQIRQIGKVRSHHQIEYHERDVNGSEKKRCAFVSYGVKCLKNAPVAESLCAPYSALILLVLAILWRLIRLKGHTR